MTEGMLDVLVFIMTLAVVIGLAFSIILPLSKPYTMVQEDTLKDKSILSHVQDADSVVVGGVEPRPIKYTAEGVVLVSQVQDPTMPRPRNMRVGERGKVIEVDNLYKLELLQVASELWGALPNKSGEYTIEYTFKNGESFQITEE